MNFLKKIATIAALLLSVTLITTAQDQPLKFEVASIKPTQAAPGSASGIQSVKSRIMGRNVTLKRCIRGAYDVPETLIFGGPKWADDERYDIDATAAGPAGGHDMMIMLQSLLAERFHLVLHREQKEISGYALVVAKGGLKAEVSAKEAASRTDASYSGGKINAQATTIRNLAQKLSEALRMPVSDFTQIEGKFNFTLSWNPDDARTIAGPSKPLSEPSAPSIFTAVQEQLGLRLESAKIPADVLIIDHAEKPSEN
jgi:uncharacterized protein (TIGR03435 family)